MDNLGSIKRRMNARTVICSGFGYKFVNLVSESTGRSFSRTSCFWQTIYNTGVGNTCRVHDQSNDETVQSQNFSENEN